MPFLVDFPMTPAAPPYGKPWTVTVSQLGACASGCGPRPGPRSAGTHLVALVGNHTLVTLGDGFTLYEVPSGRAMGSGQSTAGGDRFAVVWSGTGVHVVAGGQVQTFHVDPDVWRRGLCSSADRPYTRAERADLPLGAYTGRPCSVS